MSECPGHPSHGTCRLRVGLRSSRLSARAFLDVLAEQRKGCFLSLVARYQAPGVGVNPLNVVDGAEAPGSSVAETSKIRNTGRLIFQSAASLRVRTQSRKTHAPWSAGCSVTVLAEPCLSGVAAVWYNNTLVQVLTMADLPLLAESESQFATGNRASHARTTCSCHGRPELKPCRTTEYARD